MLLILFFIFLFGVYFVEMPSIDFGDLSIWDIAIRSIIDLFSHDFFDVETWEEISWIIFIFFASFNTSYHLFNILIWKINDNQKFILKYLFCSLIYNIGLYLLFLVIYWFLGSLIIKYENEMLFTKIDLCVTGAIVFA